MGSSSKQESCVCGGGAWSIILDQECDQLFAMRSCTCAAKTGTELMHLDYTRANERQRLFARYAEWTIPRQTRERLWSHRIRLTPHRSDKRARAACDLLDWWIRELRTKKETQEREREAREQEQARQAQAYHDRLSAERSALVGAVRSTRAALRTPEPLAASVPQHGTLVYALVASDVPAVYAYIGITDNPARRFGVHISDRHAPVARWVHEAHERGATVHMVSLTEPSDREQAQEYERTLIAALAPLGHCALNTLHARAAVA